MVQYAFKGGPLRIKNGKRASAQKIGEALTKIKEECSGRYNSKAVVAAARKETHYLHRFFEWRDSIAAEKYRQDQANKLMACIEIIEGKGKEERRLPAFISLVDRTGRNHYTVDEVLNSSDLQALALRQAEADFLAYERRLVQFADICSAIRSARELIAERRKANELPRPNA